MPTTPPRMEPCMWRARSSVGGSRPRWPRIGLVGALGVAAGAPPPPDAGQAPPGFVAIRYKIQLLDRAAGRRSRPDRIQGESIQKGASGPGRRPPAAPRQDSRRFNTKRSFWTEPPAVGRAPPRFKPVKCKKELLDRAASRRPRPARIQGDSKKTKLLDRAPGRRPRPARIQGGSIQT